MELQVTAQCLARAGSRILAVSLWAVLLGGCAGSAPAHLGVTDGRLAACPRAPHCVSSQAERAEQRVEPLHYAGARDAARARLVAAIRALSRMRIEAERADYVHAIQRSRIFGFVDDLECYLPESGGVIEVRSESRLGWYDLGVNRARVEHLRAEFDRRGG